MGYHNPFLMIRTHIPLFWKAIEFWFSAIAIAAPL
jgi:hypothetical protein